MITYLDQSKPFFKANLHCHSTLSDGRATPEKIKEEYLSRGYSIVAFTDHEHIVDNSYLSDGSFLAITGVELGIPQSTVFTPDSRTVHVNLYALDPENTLTPYASRTDDRFGPEEVRDAAHYDGHREKRIYSPEGISDLVREAHDRGFLVSLNHPDWSLISAKDFLEYDGFDFIEIYNTGCVKAGFADDETAFDNMLINGKDIFCTAADDNHNSHGFTDPDSDSFGGWVMINAESLEYGSVMSALKNGDFYASTGPEIYSLTRNGDKITVKTSPVKAIYIRSGGRRSQPKFAPDGEYLTEATFTVKDTDRVARIRIEDEHGKRAYTQAYSTAPTENS